MFYLFHVFVGNFNEFIHNVISVVLNLSTVTNCQQNFYSRKWSSMQRKNYIWHSENDDFIKFVNARILLLLKCKMFPGAKTISTISEEGGFV